MISHPSERSEPGVRNDTWYQGGRRFDDYFATLSVRLDDTIEASLVRLGGDDPELVFAVDTGMKLGELNNELGFVHPTLDGGLYFVNDRGGLLTYDATGKLISELAIGADTPGTHYELVASPT